MLKIPFKSSYGVDASYWKITEFVLTGRSETIHVYDEKDPTKLLEIKNVMKHITHVKLNGYYDSDSASSTNGQSLMEKTVTITAQDKDKYLVHLFRGAADSYEAQRDVRPFLYRCIKEIPEWSTAEDVLPTEKQA